MFGEGEYNLNALLQIKTTDSYLGMDENIRNCQNKEPLHNCTTRIYYNKILGQCGCVPFYMQLSEVQLTITHILLVAKYNGL